MRLVICDDHRLLLEALTSALARLGHTVEAATSTPREAVAAVRLHDPDVLLLDLTFPHGSGLDAAQEVVASHPRTKVVVLTGSENLAELRRALEIGVKGYVRKDQRIQRIHTALERVRTGDVDIDDILARRLARSSTVVPRPRSAADDLTPREWEIARLLEHGMGTPEIMDSLSISRSTVRSHVNTILSKLGVHSRIQAVAVLSEATGRLALVRGEPGERH